MSVGGPAGGSWRACRRPLPGWLRTSAAIVGVAGGAWWWSRSRSPYVASWRPSELPVRADGQLPARVGGRGSPTFLVLHGLGATADCFGAGFDVLAGHGRVVIPDLLGFGRAMALDVDEFTLADHLDALDATECHFGSDSPVVVGGHSLGGAVALRWAARNVDRVAGVVVWSAPLYADPGQARRQIPGAMQRAVAIDTELAAWLCARMCRYRRVASAIAVVSSPGTPSALARQAVLHTWPAYRDALRLVAFDTGWIEALHSLDGAGVPVRLIWPQHDQIGAPEEVMKVTASLAAVTVERVNGDHRYPLVRPDEAVAQLRSVRDGHGAGIQQ